MPYPGHSAAGSASKAASHQVDKQRIIVITDSVGLPRKEPEFIAVEQTWPHLLRSRLPEACIHQLSLGGATTDDVLPQLDFLDGQRPVLAVVQAGIVDCAPRAFRKHELAVLLASRAGRALLNRLEARVFRYLRRVRSVSYVPPARFAQNVQRIAKSFPCPLVWVSILGSRDYEQHLPGVTARIAEYNSLIRNGLGAQFLDLGGWIAEEHFMADGHHLNQHGHRVLLDALSQHASYRALVPTISVRRVTQ
jgi:hypothetical protein